MSWQRFGVIQAKRGSEPRARSRSSSANVRILEQRRWRAEAKKLQAIIDNPATPQIERTKAAQRLSAVTVLIEGIEAATHPVGTVGMTRPTIRYERDARGYIVGATKA